MSRNQIIDRLPEHDYFKGGHLLCPGCTGGIFWRLMTKVMGDKTIISQGATCIGLPPAVFPSVLDVPSINVSMASAAPSASGIRAALKVLKRKGRVEKDYETNVLAIAGDGGTADIGFAGLSGAAERNDDVIYFCFDNEAYMNTGIQRSSLTPASTWTTSTPNGKTQPKKDLPMIMAAHRIPYVATASIGFVEDLLVKLEKARDMRRGFRYIHVHCPCAPGWGFPENKAIEVARLAVDCGMWILFEVEHGEFKQSYEATPRKPVKEYLLAQERFNHLTAEEISAIQESVDKECETLGSHTKKDS